MIETEVRATPTPATREPFQRTPHSDRLARWGIGGAAAIVLGLLVWGHLGLGAWLLPPPATPAQTSLVAGPYHVSVMTSGGNLTPTGPNTVSLQLRTAQGQPIGGAQVRIALLMTTMAMTAPQLSGVTDSAGQVIFHPIFSMVGTWRFAITLSAPTQPTTDLAVLLPVHWPGR
jgi:hypothetical protein